MVRELDALPEQAWRAWSEAEQVRRWWGPHGFTCPRAEVHLRADEGARRQSEQGQEDCLDTMRALFARA